MLQTCRPRRNRKSKSIRNLVAQTRVSVDDLIMPLFVLDGAKKRIPIDSMPGQFRYSVDELVLKVQELVNLGVFSIALFPIIEESIKNKTASEAYNSQGLYQIAIKAVKLKFPEITIITDVALDPYSSDGHDGLVSDEGEILNDETLKVLAKMALVQAEAGSDIIAPSDMMDGRIGYIRKVLDENGHKNVSIMSYTAKYASSFYGPFRDALDSAPKAGDKKSYQMDFRNKDEALIEARLDESEGADFLMVKPGLCYLDIVSDMAKASCLPLAVYNVSGEYAMIKAADKNGWINGEEVMVEMLTSFKRAGAKIILTYFAEEMARFIKKA